MPLSSAVCSVCKEKASGTWADVRSWLDLHDHSGESSDLRLLAKDEVLYLDDDYLREDDPHDREEASEERRSA